ncbi:MAG: GntR family transcriptional regulator [Spirochaetota bacterium]
MSVTMVELEPLTVKSLKEEFISRFEPLILSGRFKTGQKLPPERELARQLRVSRPVVHEGLLELAYRGLLTIVPRKGVFINDYRTEGSIEVLISLFNYNKGDLDPGLLKSLLEMRRLIETELASMAALNRNEEHLKTLNLILEKERDLKIDDKESITEIDFNFHHTIAMATGNLIYPLLLNSFKPVYTNLLKIFYSDPSVVKKVFWFHRKLSGYIETKNQKAALRVMKSILIYGEKNLLRIISGKIDLK